MEDEYGLKLYQEFPNDTVPERRASPLDRDLTVFPNPVKDNMLQLTGMPADMYEFDVEITDVEGRFIMSKEVQGDGRSLAVPLPILSPGVYLVSVTSGIERFSRRFIILGP